MTGKGFYHNHFSLGNVLVFFAISGASLAPLAEATPATPARKLAQADLPTPTGQPHSSAPDPKKTSRLEILFGGSLCPVCLVAFQRRLASTPGVIDAKVESLDIRRAERSGHPPKRAHAIIEFAPEKITKSELETIVRQNDFQFIKTQELPATNP